MNVEQYEHEEMNEMIESVIYGTSDDHHYSGEHLLEGNGSIAAVIEDLWGVSPENDRAILTKLRELSRKADSKGVAQLSNLYQKWKETERLDTKVSENAEQAGRPE